MEQWFDLFLTQWIESLRQHVNRVSDPNFGEDFYSHSAFQQEGRIGIMKKNAQNQPKMVFDGLNNRY